MCRMIPRIKIGDMDILLINTNVQPIKYSSFHEATGIMRFKQKLAQSFVEYEFEDSTISKYNAIGVKYYDIAYYEEIREMRVTHRMLLWQPNNTYLEYYK